MEHKIDLICNCGYRIKDAKSDDYRYEGEQKRFPYCPQCNATMKHDCYTTGDYRHISDSLAFHPDDIGEHRRLFPGVDVTSEGQPIFTSVRQQEKYAEKSGFHKKAQNTHKKRKRIA